MNTRCTPLTSVIALVGLLILPPTIGAADQGSSSATPATQTSETPSAITGSRYRLEPKKSRLTVETGSSGIFSIFAHDHVIRANDLEGAAEAVSAKLDAGSFELSVKADSLALVDDVSAKDKSEIEATMKTKLLETAKYPKIVFRSTRISSEKSADGSYQVKVTGDLSLHGVKRRVSLPAKVVVNGDTLHATGKLSLRQTDYGMTPVSVAGGTVKVKDEISLSFDVVMNRT